MELGSLEDPAEVDGNDLMIHLPNSNTEPLEDINDGAATELFQVTTDHDRESDNSPMVRQKFK